MPTHRHIAGIGQLPGHLNDLEIAETRELVRSEIFGDGNYPAMLLRVGWAPINADPLPATPRRALSDFVEWTTEQTVHE